MKICIISPSLNPHGGVRVIVEWANTLAKMDYDTTLIIENGPLKQSWIDVNDNVNVSGGSFWVNTISDCDIIIATTPSIALRLDEYQLKPFQKSFFLLQMAEDMFAPNNPHYVAQCRRSYNVNMPIIGISKWVNNYISQFRDPLKDVYYIGNGVSDHFKPAEKSSEPLVMVEGWNGYNAAKDVEKLTARAAYKLKEEFPEVTIIGYGNQAPSEMINCLSDYKINASTAEICDMYQRSWMLIKATKYDARSCVPVEAMKCGTPTARALINGDDDLYHDQNCLRTEYNFNKFYSIVKELYTNEEKRNRLAGQGLIYANPFLSWEYWMGHVTKKIFKHES